MAVNRYLFILKHIHILRFKFNMALKLNRSLGSLNYVKIWHDNSGEGDFASWYLKHIIVHDLQTREKFYFICEQWMAVEKEDGKLERELFVACEPQRCELQYLLEKQSKYQSNNSHLWYSIFNRPILSSFTRLDRVTCCFVCLYLSMFFNILYYEKSSSSSQNEIQVNFIIFSVTVEQVNLN
jgi:polycystin 1L2